MSDHDYTGPTRRWTGEDKWKLTVEDVAAAYPELQRLEQADPKVVGQLDCDEEGKGPLGESLCTD